MANVWKKIGALKSQFERVEIVFETHNMQRPTELRCHLECGLNGLHGIVCSTQAHIPDYEGLGLNMSTELFDELRLRHVKALGFFVGRAHRVHHFAGVLVFHA